MPTGAVLLLLSYFFSSKGVVQADVEMVVPRLLPQQHRGAEERLLVFLPVSGSGLYLDLSRNLQRPSEKLVVEEMLRNHSMVVSSFSAQQLRFYTGFILHHPGSLAALSTFGGLMGLLQVGGHSMFIEPVEKPQTPHSFSGLKHRLWSRHLEAGAASAARAPHPPPCSYVEDHRTRMTSNAGQDAQKKRRSFQLLEHPFTIETVVVADMDVVQHHGAEAAGRFLLTVMNMVHALFQQSSLGVSLNVKVTKLVLLHTRPDTLEVSHHGERSLRSFCHWQHSEFGGRRRLGAEMSADSPTVDSAVFVTRTDFCVHKDEPCDTVGIAYLGGACSSRRKCALVEDNGLNLALTIAHELGHNLGMSHDEDHTNCTSQSHIMSGEWVKGRKPGDMSWSSCSRKDLEAFLRSKASDCLLQTDPRSQSQVRLGSKLPGMNHSVNEQCRILFGLNATFCKEMEDLMCAGLWCLTAGDEFCKTKLDAPLEGTECGTNKWCRAGECVSKTYLPQHEDGDWSLWSPWSICSRTCGTGVRFRQRKCDNPPPSPHGQPCPHASVEHGVCDGPPCPRGPLSFRDLQCRRSGTSGDMLMAVINDDKPCVLFCSSLGRGPPVLVADRVIDGTPCGPFESDLCVNGRCQKMGCDGVFGSSAQEDSCGVCDGKGRTCEVIRGDFQHTKGIGYVEAVVIPAGAWRIRVVEDKPSQSFLAVKDSRQNSINTNWKIELPGDFELAGTVVRYVRRGHWEKMSIKGPTKTPLHLMMLLLHNHSSALHYEYTMSLNTTHDQSREEQTVLEQLFIWTHSTWQDCSVQCGGGEKKTVVSCLRMVKQSMEIVNDSFCQPENRPLPKTLPCNSQPCHYRWTAGHWGGCSARCGPGVQQREVSCVQELQNGSLIPTKNRFCSGEKPSPLQDCEGSLCRMMWTASEWSECSSACGSGVQRRKVLCANPQGPCEPQAKPTEEEPCSNHSECYHWKFGEWSKCSSSCGRGLQSRVIQCMHIVTGHHGDSCPVVLRPPTYRKCYQDPCPEEIGTNSVSSWRPG
uniref:ADAM metallopeptidase with thrombospondin type 1 motif, 17 n=1 Tax=Oryzias latipes TaxID=8090 RepID=A0A3P9HQR8_ORYLA